MEAEGASYPLSDFLTRMITPAKLKKFQEGLHSWEHTGDSAEYAATLIDLKRPQQNQSQSHCFLVLSSREGKSRSIGLVNSFRKGDFPVYGSGHPSYMKRVELEDILNVTFSDKTMIVSFRDRGNVVSEWDCRFTLKNTCDKWFQLIETYLGAVCLEKNNLGLYETSHNPQAGLLVIESRQLSITNSGEPRIPSSIFGSSIREQLPVQAWQTNEYGCQTDFSHDSTASSQVGGSDQIRERTRSSQDYRQYSEVETFQIHRASQLRQHPFQPAQSIDSHHTSITVRELNLRIEFLNVEIQDLKHSKQMLIDDNKDLSEKNLNLAAQKSDLTNQCDQLRLQLQSRSRQSMDDPPVSFLELSSESLERMFGEMEVIMKEQEREIDDLRSRVADRLQKLPAVLDFYHDDPDRATRYSELAERLNNDFTARIARVSDINESRLRSHITRIRNPSAL